MTNPEDKKTTLINYSIYAVEGIMNESKIKIIEIEKKLLPEGRQVQHTKGTPFKITDDVYGIANICKFTKDDVLHYRKWIPVLYIDVWHTESMSANLLFQLFFHFPL